MNFILLAIIALFLFLISFFLIKKQDPFLTLLGLKESNKEFLKLFGIIYIILGVLALITGVWNQKILSLLLLFLIILVSGIFSVLFSKKMTNK